MNGQAALSLGSIVNRLLYVFPCAAFKAIHIDTLTLFTKTMTDLTCSFLQAVAKEEEVSDENGFKLSSRVLFLCLQTLILTFGVCGVHGSYANPQLYFGFT